MSRPATGTQAVDRAALLVSTVVNATEPISFADLQEACDLPKSTTSRMLTALERSELLERTDDGSYARAACSGSTPRATTPARTSSGSPRPMLDAIGEETHETVNLSIARGDRVVQVAQVDSQFLLGTRDWTEIDVPAHCNSLGKVFLAWDVVSLPDGRLEQPTEASLTDREELRRRPPALPHARLGDHRRRARGRARGRRRTCPGQS